MASLLARVPVEIIQEIIDVVALSDEPGFPDTNACSLTCHTFRYHSLRYIFRSITVYESYTKDPSPHPKVLKPLPRLLRSFTEILTRNKVVGNYIRELCYDIPVPSLEPEGSGPSCLEQLTNLKVLTIQGPRREFRSQRLLWDTLHSSSRSALLHLMHKPTIVSLTLRSIDQFPLSDLVPCTQLRTLNLWNVVFAEEDELLQPLHLVHLRELDVEQETLPVLMRRLGPDRKLAFKLQGIKKLSVFMWHGTIPKDAAFIQSLGSLTDLRLSVIAQLHGLSYIELAIPFLNRLRSLTLDLAIPTCHDTMYNESPQAIQKLTEAHANRIETLRINLQIKDLTYVYRPGLSPGWKMFEDLILGPYWPHMKTFELTVYATFGLLLFRTVRERLPRLSNLSMYGSIKFKYSEVRGFLPAFRR